jgi:hypothetical protein
MGNVLYSPDVIERTCKEKGYDITSYLAALFTDIGPKTEKIRSDYYESMVVVLEENFYQPIAHWLKGHAMNYVTIATWGRENLLEQTLHYGHPGNGIHSDFRQGSILGVSENFIAFDRDQGTKAPAHYLFTWAWAPREGDFQFRFGGRPEKWDYDKTPHSIVSNVPLRREAWINGAKVISISDRRTDDVVESVHLKQGYNPVLIRLVHTPGKHLGTYAVFQDTTQTPIRREER